MVEHTGLIYSICKDLIKFIKDFNTYKEFEKQVDESWLEISGLKSNLESDGFQLRWVSERKIELKKLKGYEIMYEVNKDKKEKFILRNRDTILMGKKS